jgi:putative N6-adenine-specific DNA methylase
VVREAFGLATPPKDQPAPILHVRIVKDRCTLSLDTSGELLHRRGWRLDNGRAPLRETLASGLLLLAGYDGSQPLVDPMCGSGTIAIEAALLAAGLAPNGRRVMALEAFPSADRIALQRVRDEALATRPRPHAPIHASDVHGGALHAARSNAGRAGVAGSIRLERGDVGRLAAPAASGLLVTNPPYGRRIARPRQERDDALGSLMRALTGPFAGWERFVVGPGSELRRALRLPVIRAAQLENGGLPVELLQFRRPRESLPREDSTGASNPPDAGTGLR